MYASRAAVFEQGQQRVSGTAGGMQDSSMSQAAPHELGRFKGQTAADKKDWCRSRTDTCEQDRSIRAGQR